MSDYLSPSQPGRVTRSADVTTSGSDSERQSRPLRRSARQLATGNKQNGTMQPPVNTSNGHLKVPETPGKAQWIRTPSPSPLGLIPIHSRFRSFVRVASYICDFIANLYDRYTVTKYLGKLFTSLSALLVCLSTPRGFKENKYTLICFTLSYQ